MAPFSPKFLSVRNTDTLHLLSNSHLRISKHFTKMGKYPIIIYPDFKDEVFEAQRDQTT